MKPFLLGALFIAACNPMAGDLPAPCDGVTLAGKGAECRTLVRSKCARNPDGTVDEACPTLKQCSAWGKLWLACNPSPDAGTDGGAP